MGWLSSEQLGSEHRYNSSENMNCWWFQGEDPQLCRFIAPFTIVVFHLNPNVKQVKSQFGHYKSANISYKSHLLFINCLSWFLWLGAHRFVYSKDSVDQQYFASSTLPLGKQIAPCTSYLAIYQRICDAFWFEYCVDIYIYIYIYIHTTLYILYNIIHTVFVILCDCV